MEAKHTPGPWKACEYEKQSVSDCGELYIGVDTDYPPALRSGARSIASMTGGYYTRKDRTERAEAIATNRANSRLMASAPELLEACEACIPLISANCAAGDLLRAAIAKATGRGV